MIGVDPHKQTHTAVAIRAGSGELLGVATSRKSARTYGKFDSIDALAVARAALADPDLPNAHDDAAANELKLLCDHRAEVRALTKLRPGLVIGELSGEGLGA
jgi:2,4-dienoyl-CoA reductase-like NADH-dependent reductase (Old Yellow Enzyme family)